MKELINNYKINLSKTLENLEIEKVKELCELILSVWKTNNTIYICGNGGSAANAIHIANDMTYGAGKKMERYKYRVTFLKLCCFNLSG